MFFRVCCGKLQKDAQGIRFPHSPRRTEGRHEPCPTFDRCAFVCFCQFTILKGWEHGRTMFTAVTVASPQLQIRAFAVYCGIYVFISQADESHNCACLVF